MQTVQMFDPTRDYANHKAEYQAAINKVIEKGHFINGEEVGLLEKQLSEYTGAKHAICVANGTDAMQVALMALDIGYGDEVLTVAHTWISTSEVISLLGAKPVFVDIENKTFNMDIDQIEKHITNKTKAIMPVSLYGHMMDYTKVNEIAKKYNLAVIEDGAQSFGAKMNNTKSCNATLIGTTSFFPTKPLGCWGDGGAIFTSDDALAKKIRAIKAHGGLQRFQHEYIGVNSRLDTLQAAVLLVKMKYLDDVLSQRNKNANYYNDKLKDLNKLQIPVVNENYYHVWAQYSLIVPNNKIREELFKRMQNDKINLAIFYPKPLHIQKCFNYLNYKSGDLPVTERVCDTIINLPLYGELTVPEMDYIIDRFKFHYLDLIKNL